MGPSQRGGEAESVITKVTADCSGRKQTRSPAELLFNRKVRGKISDLRIDHVYDHEGHDRDAEQQAKTKDYAATKRRVSHPSVEIGDEVLVKIKWSLSRNYLSRARDI